MGAVFALYSAWYFWIPKILGLDYSIMLGKAHFWVLFIGVRDKGGNALNGLDEYISPNNKSVPSPSYPPLPLPSEEGRGNRVKRGD